MVYFQMIIILLACTEVQHLCPVIDAFDNPSEPNVERTSIDLEYNDNYTWELPKDLYTDRDHKFKVYINDAVLNTLYYQYNKYSK